jgi:hypothetical protein
VVEVALVPALVPALVLLMTIATTGPIAASVRKKDAPAVTLIPAVDLLAASPQN